MRERVPRTFPYFFCDSTSVNQLPITAEVAFWKPNWEASVTHTCGRTRWVIVSMANEGERAVMFWSRAMPWLHEAGRADDWQMEASLLGQSSLWSQRWLVERNCSKTKNKAEIEVGEKGVTLSLDSIGNRPRASLFTSYKLWIMQIFMKLHFYKKAKLHEL